MRKQRPAVIVSGAPRGNGVFWVANAADAEKLKKSAGRNATVMDEKDVPWWNPRPRRKEREE